MGRRALRVAVPITRHARHQSTSGVVPEVLKCWSQVLPPMKLESTTCQAWADKSSLERALNLETLGCNLLL